MKSFSNYIVNTGAILHNIRAYKKINNSAKICAVVKADGYGLGVKNFVPKIQHKVDFFAVACFVEAIALRKITNKPILILNYVQPENLQVCANKNLSITIFSKTQLKQALKNVKNGILKIHFAINTGMNRIGFCSLQNFKYCFCKAKIAKNIKIEGLFTHFYNSTNKKHTHEQFCIFKHFVAFAKKNSNQNILVHAAASDASFMYPQFAFDMVRLGICLYGYGETKTKLQLALSIVSKIINITKVKKGQSVGYGKNFVAKRNMLVATVPLGYADGILRSYAKKGCVIVNNKFCKIVGNICMDMFMCDVTKAKAAVGTNVTLLGVSKKGLAISAQDIAKSCNTISYEVLTNIKQNRFNVIVK